ncbi:MAG: hypothetical protein UU93_C0003G0015 [Candidatus Amesbacteria bacterium GW2011_GWA2_42_12]|uniref:Uncharacterized protein n=1 Tax=Candidatus Amesbacteria bacterium GW2011_GWA2_42_12 TaxID=1618356 RepID=A0A0G0Y8D0_9BACT|nr:MAG: hypothetical protein UU93_C0003G0015 [Candidatus Amesbacteria bacterium GW2011_GWA2_42_12]
MRIRDSYRIPQLHSGVAVQVGVGVGTMTVGRTGALTVVAVVGVAVGTAVGLVEVLHSTEFPPEVVLFTTTLLQFPLTVMLYTVWGIAVVAGTSAVTGVLVDVAVVVGVVVGVFVGVGVLVGVTVEVTLPNPILT